jgi:hypothetical protein
MRATTLKALMGCCRVYRSETRTRFLLTWALPRRNGNHPSLLLVAVLSALLLPAVALAHVNVRPTLLVAGNETLLRIELPDLRPGRQPTGLDVSGPGVHQLSSEPSGLFGLESRFRVGLKVETEPGPLALLLLVRYADGQTVRIRQTLTVVPPDATRPDHGAPLLLWAGIAAAVLAAGAIGTLAFLNFKKKSRTPW